MHEETDMDRSRVMDNETQRIDKKVLHRASKEDSGQYLRVIETGGCNKQKNCNAISQNGLCL